MEAEPAGGLNSFRAPRYSLETPHRSTEEMNPHRGLLHHMIIKVRDVERSSPFYSSMFKYFGYELAGSSYGKEYGYEDWKRWDLQTPHEISICQVTEKEKEYCRGALGHHDHIAFCASDREDVDRFYQEVLLPLSHEGHCSIEDAPCDCPEYGEGYYATYFLDPDGLKYEFVVNPNHLIKMKQRKVDQDAGINSVTSLRDSTT